MIKGKQLDKCEMGGEKRGKKLNGILLQHYTGITEPYLSLQNELTDSTENAALPLRIIQKYHDEGQVHSDIFKTSIVDVIQVRPRNEIPISDECHWLWHGTRDELLPSIIKNGLMVPVGEKRGLVGDGIYFADRASKSAQYCFRGAPTDGLVSYLLLCKVSTGRMYNCLSPVHDMLCPPYGYDSVFCQGQYTPHSGKDISVQGVSIPIGPTVKKNSEVFDIGRGRPLMYNEYVVYDPRQAQINFIVRIKFTTRNKKL